MKRDPLEMARARQVTPRALRNRVRALGWPQVPGINGSIEVYHRPDSELHQVIIPLDPTLDDYAEVVAEAVGKLAEYEHSRPSSVLDHLLLPPADVLRFQEMSEEAESSTLPLERAASLMRGVRKSLLAVAHSVLKPQPYHPRLTRSDAEQFVASCRFGQTERGGFTFQIACPLDLTPKLDAPGEPFGRRVTGGLMRLVESISQSVDPGGAASLAAARDQNLLSANFCEALLDLRPPGDRSRFRFEARWSKAVARPLGLPSGPIEYDRETFEAVEGLVPWLRKAADPKQEAFVGYVIALRGRPDASGLVSGEVTFALVLESQEALRARADLPPEVYRTAAAAHLGNEPVYFRGTLIQGARSHRVDDVTDFRRVSPRDETRAAT